MQRNPFNTNQKLYTQSHYQGLPVLPLEGGLIEGYLSRLQQVTDAALADYAKVFAFRVDLRFPSVCQMAPELLQEFGNQAMSRFLDSFKAKMRHNRAMAKKRNPYAHDSVVRYVWAREVGDSAGMLHYHVAFLLNQDAFCALGAFELGRNNLYNRLCEAWASALGIEVALAQGLVQIPRNADYQLSRYEEAGKAAFFQRASYLCKQSTKQFGEGHHGFGASRS